MAASTVGPMSGIEPVHVFGIPNCDTVRKARAAIVQLGVDAEFHDFKKEGISPDHARRWIDAAGWQRVINRAGTTWRSLPDAVKAGVVDDASAAAVIVASPSIVKRPVVEWSDGSLTIGFRGGEFLAV